MTSDRQIHSNNNSNQHFALILAAGLSTRMGVCKTSLPWYDNKTLLRYQAEQFLLAGITPIIVLGSHNAYRRSDCPSGSKVIINFNCKRGKTSSILTGLNALPREFSSIIISAVDQPRSAYIYQTLLKAYNLNKPLIVALSYRNRMGHPLLFSSQLISNLKCIDDSTFGIRKVVKEFDKEVYRIKIADSNIYIDVNDFNAYRLAVKKMRLIKNVTSK